MNEVQLQNTDSGLVGVVQLNDFLVIAFHEQLTLITRNGEIIEHLRDAAGIPEGIQKIGMDQALGKRLVARTPSGDFWTDEEMIKWHSFNSDAVAWSESAPLPSPIKDKLIAVYQGQGLPLERVILDLHSGRILGSWGVVLFDGIAVIIILLAITGVYIFFFPAGARRRK